MTKREQLIEIQVLHERIFGVVKEFSDYDIKHNNMALQPDNDLYNMYTALNNADKAIMLGEYNKKEVESLITNAKARLIKEQLLRG